MTEQSLGWPRGLMDMASDFGSEDCGFESHRGQSSFAVQLGLGRDRCPWSAKNDLKILGSNKL